ncbi:MAG TPA: hypothetical protein VKV73_19055 [Chloroflexota bacterium]|nr:hypothetical protein [Chloroflexota bacterium]
MTTGMTVLVGTIGQGVLRSNDGGEAWQRIGPNQGMHSDALVRCLTNHPTKPEVVFAGTERGLLRSDDAGRTWRSVESPLSEFCVWKVAIHPHDAAVMFAGTGTPDPAAVFRSDDGGATWKRLPVEVAETCEAVGVPRVTGIAIDPVDPRNVWVGLEVDGARVSHDGGDSWASIRSAIPNPDVHAVAVSAGPPKAVFVLVNNDVFISRDDGGTWTPVQAASVFPWVYCRGIAVKPSDPSTVYVAIGDSTPGRTGTVMQTTDAGATWKSLDLPVAPNSAMWVVDVQPEDDNVVFAASRYGYLYRSDDGGANWTKLWREFSEVSSVLWTPN